MKNDNDDVDGDGDMCNNVIKLLKTKNFWIKFIENLSKRKFMEVPSVKNK